MPEQAQRPVAGHGLGAVGGAELAQDVADMFLTVSSAATSLPAICWFGVPRPATSAPAARGPSAARPRPGTIQMSRAARPSRDPAGVQLAVLVGGTKAAKRAVTLPGRAGTGAGGVAWRARPQL